MENLPNEDSKRIEFKQTGFNPAQTEQLLADLTTLLKSKKCTELISTFQAGTIPIMLDILSRDTTTEGQKIVTALLQQIESLKNYYDKREKEGEKEEELRKPVK